MDHFRTVVSIPPSPKKMGISDRIITIGSCFADAMGQRFHNNRFSTSANPFGVLYNPDSIHKALRYTLFNEMPPPHTFLERQGIFLNYNFHSEVSEPSEHKLSAQLKEIIGSSHYFLAHSQWLIITFGTAWVYKRNDTGEIVANCHKMPDKLFTKSLLEQGGIVESFESLYQELLRFNTNLKIILTVSPVRHIKDTLELNSVSKSILRAACHSIAGEFPNVDYFPAYEIMMDDLRDYRFYKADMIHPSTVAEEYIWDKFGEKYFSPELTSFLAQWKEILRAINHKPFHPASRAHLDFLNETLKKVENLSSLINVDNEVAIIKSQLDTFKH